MQRWYKFCICEVNKTLKFNGFSTLSTRVDKASNELVLLGQKYGIDEWTNITPKIISKLGKNLHISQCHPLSLIRLRIIDYFYKNFRNRTGSPEFSVFDNMNPIVTVFQNFDSLLVPKDHPSRHKTDCYYINQDTLLRAHMTAHQLELISMGLNNFLMIGDVFRRDEIDATHYPVFHQVDAVRIRTVQEVFKNTNNSEELRLFEHKGIETSEKQGCHTLESVKIMEHELKHSLIGLAKTLFGKDVQYRWVEQYFPFTHPSWELEVHHQNKWLEVLGCGIMRQKILNNAGAGDRIGWAFGMGLERLAMCLYDIPDIRLFWSTDSGFLNQFKVDNHNIDVKYKPISIYPQCINDISFWLPENENYFPNDFYDIVRDVGGDIVEQIILKDCFTHPKTNRISHCYSIIYRHMERTLSQKEVNEIHRNIEKVITEKLHVTVR